MWVLGDLQKYNPCYMYHYKNSVNDAFIKWANIGFPVGNVHQS